MISVTYLNLAEKSPKTTSGMNKSTVRILSTRKSIQDCLLALYSFSKLYISSLILLSIFSEDLKTSISFT